MNIIIDSLHTLKDVCIAISDVLAIYLLIEEQTKNKNKKK